MNSWTKSGMLLALVALAYSAAAQQPPAKGKKQAQTTVAQTTPSFEPNVRSVNDDPSYLIGPEDVLNISVWREPEISRSVPVRPDGKISLPLLNDVQAAGLTPQQLGHFITEKLRKYLAEPQVTVIVQSINSRRIYILGEVNRPGAFPLLPHMTVLQALSSAGGLSQFANAKKVYVLRNENGEQIKLPFNYKEVLAGNHADQNVALKPGDTIVVP